MDIIIPQERGKDYPWCRVGISLELRREDKDINPTSQINAHTVHWQPKIC